MERETMSALFQGKAYLAVSEGVEDIIVMRGKETFALALHAPEVTERSAVPTNEETAQAQKEAH